MSDNNRNQQNQHQDQGGDLGNRDQQTGRSQGSAMDHPGTTHTKSQKGSDLGKDQDQNSGGSSDSSGKEDVNLADT
jgi:hypothetical protein